MRRAHHKSHYENVPFEAPGSWAWVQLGDLGQFIRGSGIKRSDTRPSGVPCVRYGEIYTTYNYSMATAVSFVDTALAENSKEISPGDLLMTLTGETKEEIGKTIAFIGQNKTVIGGDLAAFAHHQQNPMYLSYFMNSSFAIQQKMFLGTGDLIVHISCERLSSILIPLPPINEQRRIVAAIESAFAAIDEIENTKNYLLSAVSATKSKILALAISGKLVPQDPNDEPASVLLDRIQCEREQLIKDGKIKRPKATKTATATVDSSHYENLPQSWQVYRLAEGWKLISGRDLTPSEYTSEPIGVPYITGASNFDNGTLTINRWTATPKVSAMAGDLLITCKGTVGEMAITDIPQCHIARQVMAIRNEYGLNLDFLRFVLSFHVLKITDAARGIIPGISREDLLDLELPLPPLVEQRRIVEAIDSSFEWLNEIVALL